VDQYGDAYVSGTTTATSFPVKNAFQPKYGGNTDAFLAKLNPTGSALLYSTYLGGSGQEDPTNNVKGAPYGGLAVDQNGNAYITGFSVSSNFPLRNNLPVGPAGNGVDTFVTRLDTNAGGAASLVYSTLLGFSFTAVGIAVDQSGDAYLAGSAENGLGTPGAFLTSGFGAYITRIDTNRSGPAALVYGTYLGQSNIVPEAIAVDAAGDACITGWVTGRTSIAAPDLPTTANAFQPSPVAGPGTAGYTIPEAFVTELNSTGSGLIYSTYLGAGGDGAKAYGVAFDGAGHIYITGQTTSPYFPTVNAFQSTLGGSEDAFVAEFDPTAVSGAVSLVYGSYLGGAGSGSEIGYGIAVDQSGDAFVTGQPAAGFPTVNAFQSNYYQAFLTKIGPSR
jgi:hypothetical protein